MSLGEEAEISVAQGDTENMFTALRASAAIPGAFSPVFVNNRMHVDGGLFGQFHLVADPRLMQHFLSRWKDRHPQAPLPSVRYFVIVNNISRVHRATVQPQWPAIFDRSNE